MVCIPHRAFKSAQLALAFVPDINCALSTALPRSTQQRYRAIAHRQQHCAACLFHPQTRWLSRALLCMLRHIRARAPYRRRSPSCPVCSSAHSPAHFYALQSLSHVCAHIPHALALSESAPDMRYACSVAQKRAPRARSPPTAAMSRPAFSACLVAPPIALTHALIS